MNGWYFSRPELAEHYLKVLDLGISPNLAIIAPRRKGKTLFLLQDISPLAQKKRYLPVYASLWQNINAPHEGLLLALEEAIDTLDQKPTLNRLLTAKIKKTTLSNELLGKLEVEFADRPVKVTSKDLLLLEKLLTQLQKKAGKKNVLLLIDEVQHLATSSVFDPLTHSLRTMLDKRQGQVKCIFTGSSRHYMNLLFTASQSPFYHFVETVPFPDLDETFIGFLMQKLRAEKLGGTVNLIELQDAFEAVDNSPYWMMKIVSHMITYKVQLNEAKTYILQLLEAAEGYESIAERMKPIDRLVYLALSEGKSPFSKVLLEKIDKETPVKGIYPNVQRAIKRLSEQHLISQVEKGTYNVEKPGLKRFVIASLNSKKE